MRMLVIGSSDTSGASLPDPMQAWPNLVGHEFGRAIGELVEVKDVSVVYVGPKAVPRAESALESYRPDLVVFSFGCYHFIIGTVGQRVRRRYGDRAHRLFRKLEVRFERRTANANGAPARLNHVGRRIARLVIGAEPLSTWDEVTAIQLEIMRKLAQREGMPVVVLYAPPIGESLERANRGANATLARHRAFMNSAARDHHFLVADCLPGFEAAAAQAPLRHSDGIHKAAAGHRIQADAVMTALLSPPSPFAAAAPGLPRTAATEAGVG